MRPSHQGTGESLTREGGLGAMPALAAAATVQAHAVGTVAAGSLVSGGTPARGLGERAGASCALCARLGW
eukprot:13872074-Alexandrium_andersonii.AAC.1